MRSIGEGVFALQRTVGARGFIVRTGRGLVLIDPGLSVGVGRVVRELRDQGMAPSRVTDILLTHYDFDHAQAAVEWAGLSGARTWVGSQDAAIMSGTSPVPNTWLRRMLKSSVSRLPALVTQLDSDDEIVGGIRAVATPGHTPGHFVYVWADVAFIGDTALVSTAGRLSAMPSFLDTDPALAAKSRALVESLPVRTWCAGHSAPVSRGV